MDALASLPVEPVTGSTLCRTPRRVAGRVRVSSREEVCRVLAACAARGLPVHPISGGKNWGMGSYLPPRDDCLVLDLGGMKQIGPLDRMTATVRIEPGVTQRELYDYLQRESPELAFNVTGSGQHTSVLGCGCERGLGYAGGRADDLFGCEVVLADGTVHAPESGWFSRTGLPAGGPELDRLWFQTNFGIITGAWLRLRRRQEVEAAVALHGDLEGVFETVREAFWNGVFTLPVHQGGGIRAEQTQRGLLRLHLGRVPTEAEYRSAFGGHSAPQAAVAALHGTREQVRAARKALRRLKRPGVRVLCGTARDFALGARVSAALGLRGKSLMLAAVRPLIALTWGEPSDEAAAALPGFDRPDQDLDALPQGCIYFNAISPLDVSASRWIEAQVAERWSDYALTRNYISGSELVHIISLHFAPENHSAAAAAAEDIRSACIERGYPPYRLPAWGNALAPAAGVAQRIKRALDPEGLISPGHYVS